MPFPVSPPHPALPHPKGNPSVMLLPKVCATPSLQIPTSRGQSHCALHGQSSVATQQGAASWPPAGRSLQHPDYKGPLCAPHSGKSLGSLVRDSLRVRSLPGTRHRQL